MPIAELVDGRIEFEIGHREKFLLKQLSGKQWIREDWWWVPLSWASCVALRGVFGDTLIVGDKLNAWAALELGRRVTPALKLRSMLEPEVTPEWFDDWAEGLYPFQVVGAAFASIAEWSLNADEMRLGKTVQTIAALRAKRVERALVVSPNSVKRGWKRELEKWWPEMPAYVYRPGKPGKDAINTVRDDGGILIVNWENTHRLSKLAKFGSINMTDKDLELKALNFIDWDAVVVDEAHRMKEPRAKQTRAAWSLLWSAPFRMALTGTPVANSPRDLWSIMHGLAPDEYPGYTAFVDRYGLQSWNAFGGLEVVGLNPTTSEEFFKFFDARFIRRTRSLVRPDLPDKSYVTRYVTLTGKQKKAYDELKKNMLTELDTGELAYVTNPLAKVGRLRQVAASYVDVQHGEWKLTEPSAKLDELDAVIEEAGEESVIVFAEHRQLIELYADRLRKRQVDFGMITGAVDEEDRQQAVDDFQTGRIKLVLATFGAGGEGITLSRATILVMLQRTYSAIKDNQAVDRGIDLTNPDLEIVDIVVEDSIEERIFEVLEEKGERLEEICRDRERLRQLLGG